MAADQQRRTKASSSTVSCHSVLQVSCMGFSALPLRLALLTLRLQYLSFPYCYMSAAYACVWYHQTDHAFSLSLSLTHSLSLSLSSLTLSHTLSLTHTLTHKHTHTHTHLHSASLWLKEQAAIMRCARAWMRHRRGGRGGGGGVEGPLVLSGR